MISLRRLDHNPSSPPSFTASLPLLLRPTPPIHYKSPCNNPIDSGRLSSSVVHYRRVKAYADQIRSLFRPLLIPHLQVHFLSLLSLAINRRMSKLPQIHTSNNASPLLCTGAPELSPSHDSDGVRLERENIGVRASVDILCWRRSRVHMSFSQTTHTPSVSSLSRQDSGERENEV